MQELQEKKTFSTQLLAKQLSKSVSNLGSSYSTEHFEIYLGSTTPATSLWNDYNQNGTPDFIDTIMSEMEFIYTQLVTQAGFKTPLGEGKIKIYIANSGLYLDGSLLSMSDSYVGWALYEEGESYFVVNGSLTGSTSTNLSELLKVTLAHEFFHLIQYAYNFNISNANEWLYESTAVFIEYFVYPLITDYLKTYGALANESLKRGLIDDYSLYPYASNLFFDFLSHKFQDVNMIKKIWEYFEFYDNSIEAVQHFLSQYESSIEKELYDYAYALLYNTSQFSHSLLFEEYVPIQNNLDSCDQSKLLSVGLYAVLSNDTQNSCNMVQLNLNDNLYEVNIYDGKTTLHASTASLVSNEGIFVILPSSGFNETENLLKYYEIKATKYIPKMINVGWNLLSTHKNININDIDKSNYNMIWQYSNNSWKLWHAQDMMLSSVEPIVEILAGDGFWVHAKSQSTFLDMSQITSQRCDFSLSENWNLKGLNCLTPYKISKLESLHNIQYGWVWRNNVWLLNLYGHGFEVFNRIEPNEGIWIKK